MKDQFGNTEKLELLALNSSLREKHAYYLGYLHFTSRYSFSVVKCYSFYIKNGIKILTRIFQMDILTSRAEKKNQSTLI